MKRLLFLLVFSFLSSIVEGSSEDFAADVSFVVIDFKYNAKQGVKVCEVQQALISAFKGLTHITGSNDTLGERLFEVLSPYQNEIWLGKSQVNMRAFSRFGEKYGWTVHAQTDPIDANPHMLSRARLLPQNPNSLLDYQGIAYIKCIHEGKSKQFRKKFPGILLMDGAAAGPCRNKLTMNRCFAKDLRLAQYKPRWKLYKKKYFPGLANKIIRDIDSEIFVIKPLNELKGRGIIIVHKDDLEETLYCILKQKKKALHHPDPAFKFWSVAQDKTFIVEEFVPSDPVVLSHVSEEPYDPTCRYIVLLRYHENSIYVDFLESFLKVPPLSLNEEGSLNERHKSYGRPPYYKRIPEGWQKPIREQLREALTLLYQQMLRS